MISRLQKRCFLTSAGAHALLAALLLLAPAFRRPRPDLLGAGLPLELFPGELVDAALAPGPPPGAAEEPALPASPSLSQPVVLETPAPSEPAKPAENRRDPPREPAARTTPPVETAPPKLPTPTPQPKPATPRTAPRIDLRDAKPIKPLASRNPAQAKPEASRPDRNRPSEIASALARAAGSLRDAAGRSAVQIQIGGGGGEGGGGSGYAWHVRQAYDNAWIAPQDVKDDLATTIVEVSVRRDGRVLAKRIARNSGFVSLDQSVQRALDRVTEIGVPFEGGATDSERIYVLEFNLRSRRSL